MRLHFSKKKNSLLIFTPTCTDPEAHYYTLKAFHSQSISFCYQNVSFRPQSVPFHSQSILFRINRSNRFVKSVPSKAHISGPFLWNCSDLQDNFEFKYVIKTKHPVFCFMVECKNCSSCMYLYRVRETSSYFRKKNHGSSILPIFDSLPWILIWCFETLMKAFHWLLKWSRKLIISLADHGFFISDGGGRKSDIW